MAKTATFNLEDFSDSNPREYRWIMDNHASFDFARAMKERVEQTGFLTHNMTAAVHKCMNRAPQATAAVDTGELEKVFARVNPTLKKPAINVGPWRFSPAPVNGKNPGAIYVKHEGVYMGKMLGGRFLASMTQEAMQTVLAIAADPLGKAIEHGRLTGRCAICNRNLKDEDSTDRGIGPVCAAKFGWTF